MSLVRLHPNRLTDLFAFAGDYIVNDLKVRLPQWGLHIEAMRCTLSGWDYLAGAGPAGWRVSD